uniref:Uncharacterized protein n=3 Tax=Canis lupus TaxID=9612 RepID=A0A8I3RSS0_CANLF
MEKDPDPKSNKRRGFVSVAFKEEGPVKKVLEKRSRTISGSKCAIQGAHAEGCAQPRAALGAVGTAAQDPAAALGRGGGQSPGTGNQGDGHPRGRGPATSAVGVVRTAGEQPRGHRDAYKPY